MPGAAGHGSRTLEVAPAPEAQPLAGGYQSDILEILMTRSLRFLWLSFLGSGAVTPTAHAQIAQSSSLLLALDTFPATPAFNQLRRSPAIALAGDTLLLRGIAGFSDDLVYSPGVRVVADTLWIAMAGKQRSPDSQSRSGSYLIYELRVSPVPRKHWRICLVILKLSPGEPPSTPASCTTGHVSGGFSERVADTTLQVGG